MQVTLFLRLLTLSLRYPAYAFLVFSAAWFILIVGSLVQLLVEKLAVLLYFDSSCSFRGFDLMEFFEGMMGV